MPRQRNFYKKPVQMSSEAYNVAKHINELFYARDADHDIVLPINWPDKQSVLGKATAIGYRSDKWEEVGEYKDYIHKHEHPLPDIIRRKAPGDIPLVIKNPENPADKKAFKRPKDLVFAFLGYALDLEFERDGRLRNLDWKSDPNLPILAADTERRLLLIIPQDGSSLLMLHSPILLVTEAGIEN